MAHIPPMALEDSQSRCWDDTALFLSPKAPAKFWLMNTKTSLEGATFSSQFSAHLLDFQPLCKCFGVIIQHSGRLDYLWSWTLWFSFSTEELRASKNVISHIKVLLLDINRIILLDVSRLKCQISPILKEMYIGRLLL